MTVIRYSLTKDKNRKLSANFSVVEFACQDGSDAILIDSRLVLILQKIRDHFGRPVHITSAFRSVAHNAKVGGASNSLHTKGMASDIYIDGIEPAVIAAYAEKIGVLGVGLYTKQRFVHVDTRTNKYYWKNAGKEVAVQTHGGLPTYANMIQTKTGLGEGTIRYLQNYAYPFDLLEKIAINLK